MEMGKVVRWFGNCLEYWVIRIDWSDRIFTEMTCYENCTWCERMSKTCEMCQLHMAWRSIARFPRQGLAASAVRVRPEAEGDPEETARDEPRGMTFRETEDTRRNSVSGISFSPKNILMIFCFLCLNFDFVDLSLFTNSFHLFNEKWISSSVAGVVAWCRDATYSSTKHLRNHTISICRIWNSSLVCIEDTETQNWQNCGFTRSAFSFAAKKSVWKKTFPLSTLNLIQHDSSRAQRESVSVFRLYVHVYTWNEL